MQQQTLERDFDLTEIINGEEIVPPSPFRKHQGVIFNLTLKMGNYIINKRLGKLYTRPLDVILKEGEQKLQPDILFIKKENMAIAQDWIRGVPDMVCEVISQWSHSRDTITKKEIYERYKVPEYWIVVPELKTIEVLTIEGGRYRLLSEAIEVGIVRSEVIDGLEIDIKDVFDE
ncbi:MAG: Uma2 family endonuclease [Nitrospirae bacterium]|nr:Uma2 family endonuclease [Nitrospirota bacterium]MBF0593139.1 Uma2 family endonuclease [Nitrospirota bacterium]